MMKMQAYYDLLRLAESFAPIAGRKLDPTKDDLRPYMTSEQEVELLQSLLLKAELAHLMGKSPESISA